MKNDNADNLYDVTWDDKVKYWKIKQTKTLKRMGEQKCKREKESKSNLNEYTQNNQVCIMVLITCLKLF